MKVCCPSASAPPPSPATATGDEHGAGAKPSSVHRNLAPGSLEKLKLALVELLSASGWLSMLVSGAVVSIVQLKLAAAPVLPAVSAARTEKLWLPSPRLL